MPSSQNDVRSNDTHLRDALEHARRLSETRTDAPYTAAWSVQAHHVGDLSVLALAMRD